MVLPLLLFTVVRGGGLAVVCLSHFSYRVESINRTALYAGGRSLWRLIDVGPVQEQKQDHRTQVAAPGEPTSAVNHQQSWDVPPS